MAYSIHGTLRGLVCDRCPDPLFPARVLIYTSDRLLGRDKEVFEVRRDDDPPSERRLVAEAETDARGRYHVSFDDPNQQGRFDVDVRLDRAPGQDAPARGTEPVQATVAQVEVDDGEAEASVTLAPRLWCRLRALLDAWVICGRVLNVSDGAGVGGLTVEAFDRDWLQNDALGAATTDGDGRFAIHYTSADFKETPFSPLINVELTGGPDVYFRVSDSGGVALVEEGPAAGRQPGRENVGHCFCVTLRVQVGDGGGDDPPVDDPLLTHVGDYRIDTLIDPATGLTTGTAPEGDPSGHGGAGFGFFGTLKLKGFAPEALPAGPGDVYYRFVFEDADAPSSQTPVTGAMVAATVVGNRWIQWDQDDDGFDEWRPQSVQVRSGGATPGLPTPTPGSPPPPHVVVPDGDGWIPVVAGTSGGGYQLLLRFATAQTTGLTGGAPGATPRDGTKIRLRYQVARGSSGGPPTGSPDHESEAVLYVNNWAEVRTIELIKNTDGGSTTTDPCAPALGSSIDVKYAVDHELLRSWDLSVAANDGWSSAGPSGSTPRGGAGAHTFALGPGAGGPAHCSHTVTLGAQRRLTTGEDDDDRDTTTDTFCT